MAFYQNVNTGRTVWAKCADSDGSSLGKQWSTGDWLIYSLGGWLETVLTPEEFATTFVPGEAP